jgi:hypothetical protein
MPRWKDNTKVDLREMHSEINQPKGWTTDELEFGSQPVEETPSSWRPDWL